ncbi:MAG: hypothetical protein CBD26_00045 [Candidatus Pelagibacter sp. TMED166]|nr:MAG: hypothetical protein CBD26_00045 [Candidatus Pelagibacter sp. TMED166]|tara:strand:+ start:705 stop:1676 length:972 start_codon:yes stop_codon:yes gene_type:complete
MSKIGFFKKVNPTLDVPVDTKLSRLSTPLQISNYMKKHQKALESEYHETDRLEVKEVIRNKPGVRLGVRGVLINGKSDPGLVIPAQTHTTVVPLVGEHVNVIEREGVVYFTDITNRKGSLNENSIPGVVGDYNPTTQYGKDFKRQQVPPINLGEGCITHEGRFGQTIHFDGHDNTPKIKISTHQSSSLSSREENIDGDDSSIYLLSRGMRDKFDGNAIEGKKVLIQSDGIFITGRKEVKINAPNLSVINDEIKLGSRDAIQPVVLGNELVSVIKDLISAVGKLAFVTGPSPGAPAGPSPTNATVFLNVQAKLNSILSKKVKTV